MGMREMEALLAQDPTQAPVFNYDALEAAMGEESTGRSLRRPFSGPSLLDANILVK